MSDQTTPLRELLNRSGVPFQLAVEHAIVAQGRTHGIELVRKEVPWTDGFIDIVARKSQILFAIECKRLDDKPWLFVSSQRDKTGVTRCRLEWFNGRAPVPRLPFGDHSRVFFSEWNVVEPSPESDYCIVPKDTPIKSLERVCSELLEACHDILANEDLIHGGDFAAVVPVIVTNAVLKVCYLDPAAVPLETGKVDANVVEFVDSDFVRFRKSLVNRRGNSYDDSQMVLLDWAMDRERTVFVVKPDGLSRFFAGFRSFTANDFGGVPKEFRHPPKLDEDWLPGS